MPRPRSITSMTCQNSACQFFLIGEGKDLVKNGKNSAGNRQYFCKHCRIYFVETKNTPFYRSRLDRAEVEFICRHTTEKTSMRGVARVTGRHRDTISRYYRLLGEHAERLNNHTIQEITPGRVELGEFWTFVQKK